MSKIIQNDVLLATYERKNGNKNATTPTAFTICNIFSKWFGLYNPDALFTTPYCVKYKDFNFKVKGITMF